MNLNTWYYYMRNGKGLSISHGFTSKKDSWIKFSLSDKVRMDAMGVLPYGTKKKGEWIEI